MPLSALLLPAALTGVAGGVLLADAGWLGVGTLPLVAAVGAGVAVAAGGLRRTLPALVGVLLLGAALGAWRGAESALPSGPGSVTALVGRTEWELTGTLIEEPRPRGERVQVILDQVTAADGERLRPARGRILVWLPRSSEAAAGDRIALRSTLEEPRDFDGFAYRAYLARQGIAAIAQARAARVVDHRLGALPESAAAARRWLLDGLNRLVPEPEAALGAGILLGVRSGISPEIGDAFAAAGLTHVVAISGWNIAIVAALVAAGLRPLQRRPGGRWLVPLTMVVTIAAYVVLTGSSPSVVRAALMASAMLIARLGGSRAHAASALLLAALVMLLAAPPVLWDVGFQLSLLATAGLVWFGNGVERRLAWLPSVIREPIALTLAAQLTTLPVIVLNFERLSLVAPVANVLAGPLVPLVMLCCAVAAPVGAVESVVHLPLLGGALDWLVGGSTWLYLHLLILAGTTAASVPFASVPLSAPAWLALAWYPMLAGAWLRRGRSDTPEAEPLRELTVATSVRPRRQVHPLIRQALRPGGLVAANVLLLGTVSLASLPDGRLHLVMLDVGQGDAILVRAPSGATLLVDGGPDPDVTLGRLGAALPFFQRRIDVVLLTHPHQDHVAGLVEVLRRYRVDLVLDSGRAFENPSYARFVELAGQRLHDARAGQRLALDQRTTLTILYPTEADAAAPLPDDDINNASVVALLRCDAFSALLTGDAEAPVEARLADRGLLVPVDVLKVGHHGSASSTSPPMLDGARPLVALISDGVDNDYGHPSPKTLAALAAAGVRIRRTDREGSVEVTSDGRWYQVSSRVARDPPHAVRALARPEVNAGSIGPWPFRGSTTPARSLAASTCPRGSSSIRRGCGAWPRRPRDSSSSTASRLTSASSRSPPCCTTSTSPRPERPASRTAWWPRAG